MERLQIGVAHSERASERRGVIGHPVAMPFRVAVARLDHHRQRADDGGGRVHFVYVPLDARERADTRQQLGAIDGNRQEVVRAGFERAQPTLAIGLIAE